MSSGDSIRVPSPVELLQQLIRFDTSNPPGQERECALWIKDLLVEHGIEAEMLAPEDALHRPSIVARIQAHQKPSANPLLLHGHTDVVSVHGQNWTHDPFEGVVAYGCVWGRGAVDMKGGLAMMLHAILRAKHEQDSLPNDVLFAAVADEELGGIYGAKFLIEKHPHLFKGVKHAFGEIGGFTTHIRGKRFYPVMVAEKHICRLRITFTGLGGHGSQIHINSAMSKAAKALRNLDRYKPPYRIGEAPKTMFRYMSQELPFPANVVMRMAMSDRTAGLALKLMDNSSRLMLEPMVRNTITPTIIEGGAQENASPATVSVLLDCRLLPGQTAGDITHQVRNIIGHEAEIEIIRYDEGPSTVDMELMPFLAGILERADQGAKAIPFMVAGGTDAKWFHSIGIDTYGFTPMLLPADINFMALFHATDERIPIDALNFGAELMHQAITTYQP